MNALEYLNAYLRRLEARLRLAVLLRGAAWTAATALVSTVLVAVLMNRFAFSERSVTGGRFLLLLCISAAAGFGVLVPLLRMGRRKAARSTEEKFPQFEQRLLTFAEKQDSPGDRAFLELMAEDTIERTRGAQPQHVVTNRFLAAALSMAAVTGGSVAWLAVAGPGFLGHGASLLWSGVPRTGGQPFYDLVVSPGNRQVRRGATQAVTARLVGFQSSNVRLLARYRSSSKWEEAVMLPQEGLPAYGFLFAGIPETVDYYVDAGLLRSKTYTLSVVDLPAVQQIRVTYRFPSWTGMAASVEEHGGDLRAVEGTVAEVAVRTDRPLENGVLVLDGGTETPLAGSGDWRNATVGITRDGSYYVAARLNGELVRLSDDYFIEAQKDGEPLVRIVRPGRDARVSPIEEVTVAVEAADDFGLRQLDLRYSVNGGPERSVALLKDSASRNASGSTMLPLEDFGLVPGDVVAIYATARDARQDAKTDLFFIEAQPFEREYSQSQQAGGGEMGGNGDNESRISQRQKEIIAATWNQSRNPSRDARENGKFLAGVQEKLRAQAKSLADRMRRRELAGQNQEFKNFADDMEKASEAMAAAAAQLQALKWQEALQPEQKALQHLLRAEAMFRQIQVAFGRGNSGGGGGMGRDLESLFDLELDTERTQYESGQRRASAGDQARETDEALRRLEELARRQQELADRQRNPQQVPQQRWQQEMLRREAEELQRRLEQLTRGEPSSSGDGRLQQALERLRQATEDMRQAGQESGRSRRAAERLGAARDLMRGMRNQQSSQRMDDLVRQAEELAQRQQDTAQRVGQLFPEPTPEPGPTTSLRRGLTKEQFEESRRLAEEKQKLAERVAGLEREMQNALREMSGTQPVASSRVRRALGDMQKDELALRMRYNTELLRQGLGPYVKAREAPVTQALENLRDQLREARSAMNRESGAAGSDVERALAQVQEMRRRMEQMAGAARGNQRGQAGAQGAGGRNGGNSATERSSGDPNAEQLARGGVGSVNDYGAINRGDRLPPAARADLGRFYWDNIRGFQRLRESLRDNPEAAGDAEQLVRQMQRLDPARFPGNPELLARMYAELLPALEQIELQLRRKLDEQEGGQIRSGASEPVPEGYADAVAEYFRRLNK